MEIQPWDENLPVRRAQRGDVEFHRCVHEPGVSGGHFLEAGVVGCCVRQPCYRR